MLYVSFPTSTGDDESSHQNPPWSSNKQVSLWPPPQNIIPWLSLLLNQKRQVSTCRYATKDSSFSCPSPRIFPFQPIPFLPFLSLPPIVPFSQAMLPSLLKSWMGWLSLGAPCVAKELGSRTREPHCRIYVIVVGSLGGKDAKESSDILHFHITSWVAVWFIN